MHDYFHSDFEIPMDRCFLVPRELLEGEKYRKLGFNTKMLYISMLARMDRYGKEDENGRMYITYKLDEIMEDLKVSVRTAHSMAKKLVEYGLIERVRDEYGKPYKIYMKDVEWKEYDHE